MEKIHHGDIDKPIVYNGNKHIIHKGAMFGYWKVINIDNQFKVNPAKLKCICTHCIGKKTRKSLWIYELNNLNDLSICRKCSSIRHGKNMKGVRRVYVPGAVRGIYKLLKHNTDGTIIVQCLKCNIITTKALVTFINAATKNIINTTHCMACNPHHNHLNDNRGKSRMTVNDLKTIFKMYYHDNISKYTIAKQVHYSINTIYKWLDMKKLYTIPPNVERKKFDIDKVIYAKKGVILQKNDIVGIWELLEIDIQGEVKVVKCKCIYCGHVKIYHTHRIFHIMRSTYCKNKPKLQKSMEKLNSVLDNPIVSSMITVDQKNKLRDIRL